MSTNPAQVICPPDTAKIPPAITTTRPSARTFTVIEIMASRASLLPASGYTSINPAFSNRPLPVSVEFAKPRRLSIRSVPRFVSMPWIVST